MVTLQRLLAAFWRVFTVLWWNLRFPCLAMRGFWLVQVCSCKVQSSFLLALLRLSWTLALFYWVGNRWSGLKQTYPVPEGQLESAWQVTEVLSLVFEQHLIPGHILRTKLCHGPENITITSVFWKQEHRVLRRWSLDSVTHRLESCSNVNKQVFFIH